MTIYRTDLESNTDTDRKTHMYTPKVITASPAARGMNLLYLIRDDEGAFQAPPGNQANDVEWLQDRRAREVRFFLRRFRNRNMATVESLTPQEKDALNLAKTAQAFHDRFGHLMPSTVISSSEESSELQLPGNAPTEATKTR